MIRVSIEKLHHYEYVIILIIQYEYFIFKVV